MVVHLKNFDASGNPLLLKIETERSAKEREAEISFVGWYDNSNRLYSDTEVVHGKEIVEWLINNKKQILDFLQKIS